MNTLMETVQSALKKEQARIDAEMARDRERVERVHRRCNALAQSLQGFNYEIDWDERAVFFIALRHPHEPAKWLAFVVESFSSDDEPVLPLQAREIGIFAGRVTEHEVPLALAAAEYMNKDEQE